MYVDATKRARGLPVDLTAALNASGVIGAWSWSSRSDRCVLDAGAAEVLAGDRGLAGRPVPLETAKACVHPDDRPALFRNFQALRRTGGLFVAEYRTISPSGAVRRILDRGRVGAGASSRREGHGIIIDVTEAVPGDHVLPGDGEPIGRAGASEPADALSRAVDHAIECRDAVEGIEDPELQLLVDMLLLRLGRKAAALSMGAPSRLGH